MDLSKVQIKVLSPNAESIEQVLVNSAKQQEQHLKEKYKNYRKNKESDNA
jgi:hypothetical protein